MAVMLINPFAVAADSEEAFLAAWRAKAEVFAGAPGYIDTRLHRSLDPDARFRFVNVAHWVSAEAWVAAMAADPPGERDLADVVAHPALYVPAEDAAVGARSASPETCIRGLEERLAEAYQANDTAFLDWVLADDYRVTDGPGTTSEKCKVLDDHATKRLRVITFRFDEMEVQRLGLDAAVVTGRYTWDAAYDGHPIPGVFRYLRVYERAGASWRITAGQVTPVIYSAAAAPERDERP